MITKFENHGASTLKLRVKRLSYQIESTGREIELTKDAFEEAGGFDEIVDRLEKMEIRLQRMRDLLPCPENCHDAKEDNRVSDNPSQGLQRA